MHIRWIRFVLLLVGIVGLTACGSRTAASTPPPSARATQTTPATSTAFRSRPSASPSRRQPATHPAQPSGLMSRTLTLNPSHGPAGSVITLSLTSSHRPPQGVANICWGGCGPSSYTTGVRFHRVGPHRYQGTTRLPGGWLALPGGFARVLEPGSYALSVTCLTSQPGCAYRPEVTTRFRLTRGPVVTPWSALPRGPWHQVPTLGAVVATTAGVTATDPGHSGRRVSCRPAPLEAGQSNSGALVVTGPEPFRTRLSAQIFGSTAGEVGCRAVALDPHDMQSVYAAGLIDPGANGPMAFPPPMYSTNGGQTWQRVPTPPGLSFGADFVGFSASPVGVAAWFSPAASPLALNPADQVAGEETVDGGKHWHPVSLACPATGPCAWQVNTFLVSSTNHGQSWQVASFQSHSIHGQTYWGPDGSLVVFEPDLFGRPFGQYPLLRSTDQGAHWTFVSLPAPPGGWIKVASTNAGQAFLASDGALVAQEEQGSRGTWLQLPPAGSQWDRISGPPASLFPGQGS